MSDLVGIASKNKIGPIARLDRYEAVEVMLTAIAEALGSCPDSNASTSDEEVDQKLDGLFCAGKLVRKAFNDLEGWPDLQGQVYRLGRLILSSIYKQSDAEAAVYGLKAGFKRHTYIIRNPKTGDIKIGVSISPESRINGLGLSSGVQLETLAIIGDDIEKQLHARFDAYRIHGEWFDDRDGKIADYVSSLP